MNRLRIFSRNFLLCLVFSAQPIANAATLFERGNHEIGTSGYFRAALGSSAGTHQSCFQAPGAGAKFRLGNECDVYAMPSLHYRYRQQEEDDSPYFHLQATPELFASSENYSDYTFGWIDAFVEVGNIGNSPVTAWAGRRNFFLRQNILLNDYFYMNTFGDGLGVRDIPLNFGNLHYTLMKNGETPSYLPNYAGKIYQRNHDISLTEISTDDVGSFRLDLRWSRIDDKDYENFSFQTYEADGWAISAQHDQYPVFGGSNTLILQYGKGAARSAFASPFEPSYALDLLASNEAAAALEDAQTWRAIDYHVIGRDHWALMSVILWERKDSYSFDFIDQSWTSLGLRPTWFVDEHWRLMAEPGIDVIDDHAFGNDGHVWKLTLALAWAPERSVWSRPAFRAFVTHAAWSENFKGQVGGPAFADQRHGWNIGIQLETWW